MNRQPFNLTYNSTPDASNSLDASINWYAQTLVIDNHSATGYLYVPSAGRYVAPLQMGAIVNIPSSQDINVVWQNPPNQGSAPSNGDLASITAYSIILHPANGNTASVPTGDVTSVFGRTGAVVAETGDYTAAQVGALADNAAVGGDLSGTVPDPKVAGLQGIPVSATAPANGDALVYNGTEWLPGNSAAPVTSVFGRTGAVVAETGDYTAAEVGALADNAAVGGDLSGTVPDPTVARIQSVPVSATAPTTGQILEYNGTEWIPTTPAATTNAGELQGVPISATTPTNGQGLVYNGTDWIPTTPSSNATEIQSIAVSATAPTNGQVLAYNGTDWVPTAPDTNATEIQSIAVSATAPTNGQVLAYNGTDWVPTNPSSFPLSTPQSGELTANVQLTASVVSTILTTPVLAVGTWLISAGLLAYYNGSYNIDAAIQVGSAIAEINGQSSTTGADGSNEFSTLTLCALVTITTAGTISIVAESTEAAIIRYQSQVGLYANASGWTATRVA